MRVQLLTNATMQDGRPGVHSIVVNNQVAVNAGYIGFYRTPFDQALVKHVLLSDSLARHVVSLPIFVENVYDGDPNCVTVYGSAKTLADIQRDLFNDRVWPDFIGLTTDEMPFMKVQAVKQDQPLKIGGLQIGAVPLDNEENTLAFVIDDGTLAAAFVSHNGPKSLQWEDAHSPVKAIFVEVPYPDSQAEQAAREQQFTPSSLVARARQIQPDVQIVIVPVKSHHAREVAANVASLNVGNLVLAQSEAVYDLG